MNRSTLTIVGLLSIIAVAAVGYTLFTNIFRDTTPPVIDNLTWEPTREINDKIYDGTISFSGVDADNPLVYAEVQWKPVNYTLWHEQYQTPLDFFPQEDDRTHVLQPIDGVFDEVHEEFEIQITNIIGGREYEIEILLRDQAGNEKHKTLQTPYIREYENLGKLLYDNGLVIGVNGMQASPDPIPWEDQLNNVVVHPLMGEFDCRNPIAIAKQIDIFTGYGGNCIFFSWGWDDEEQINHIKLHDVVLNYVSSPFINQTHIAITYEGSRVWFHGVPMDEEGNLHLDDPEQWAGVVEDFKVLNNTFFNRDNYLKINGKPVVYWYYSDALNGAVDEFLNDLRNAINSNVFLFSDHAKTNVIVSGEDVLGEEKYFDGWSTWAASWYIPVDEPKSENFPKAIEIGYKAWSEKAEQEGKVLMPSIIPGFVDLNWEDYVLPRDEGMFSKELEIAVNYATLIEGKKLIKIDTWGDFTEGHVIQPTQEEGFKFLEVIKNFVLAYLKLDSSPIISNFTWTPTRIVNDKVYDGAISFTATDLDSIITNATARFIPKTYSHLSPNAFPNDRIREFKIKPTDDVFDESNETFQVDVTNITGGREYIIEVIIHDHNNNIATATQMTPYLREFENVGKQLYDQGVRIGTIYAFLTVEPWNGYLTLNGPYEPLLGYYVINTTEKLIVIDKHLDWMSGHGINFIAIPGWVGIDLGPDFNYYLNVFRHTMDRIDTFNMKFAITYDQDEYFDRNMSDPRGIQMFKSDLALLAEQCFNHPAYLTIDDQPFFWTWDTGRYHGDIKSGFQELHDFMNQTYGIQMYMINDDSGLENRASPYADPPTTDLASVFAAFFTGWHPTEGEYDDLLQEGYDYWQAWSASQGIDFIAGGQPGWSNEYCPWVPAEIRSEVFPRTIELWKQRIAMAIPYSDTLILGDFNCFVENNHLEPNIQEGFTYLEALRETLIQYYLTEE